MGDGLWVVFIGEGTTVQDLVPGKPVEMWALASKLSRYAAAFETGAQRVRSLDTSGWEGEAAEAFRERVTGLPKKLDAACEAFSSAASAVRTYREVLISAQGVAGEVIRVDAVEARAKSRRHAAAVADYQAAVDQGVRACQPAEVDPGIGAMAEAVARVERVRGEVETASWEAVKAIREAAGKAPSKPGGGFRSFLSGVKEAALELADTTVRYAPVRVLANPEGWVRDVATDVDGVRWGASHPVEFAKAAVDWDMWRQDPDRALGRLVPGSVLAVVTGGSGLGRRGVSAIQQGARNSLRQQVREGAARLARPWKKTPRTADPIDLTSGRVLMPQTDLVLPGDLPLVVERVHDSSSGAGRWFGPSWSSTFDQRLELDGEGAVFVGPEGVVLSYPVPVPGEPVLPSHGPRWPLSWDGVPGSTMRIEIPERGWTWTFEPLGEGFDPADLPVRSLTDRNGQRIDFLHGPDGEPLEVRHSAGYRVAVDTDPHTATRIIGLRVLEDLEGPDDGGGTQVLSYGYDEAGNLAEIVNSSNEPLRFTYDEQSRMTSWTDRNHTTYTYVYDEAGRCVRAEGTDGFLACQLSFDEDNRTTRFTNSLGHTTLYRYHHAHQLVSETDPLGNTTHREWDETGRLLTAVTDPSGHTTRYTYDPDENLTAIIRPDGSQVTATYSPLRLPESVTAPDGTRWAHTYDERGNRTSTTDPTGAVTHYAHDDAGRLTGVTDPLGHTTHLEPNPAGLPLRLTNPLGHTTTVERDAFGRPTTLTDPLGQTTRMDWTVEGKPARRQHPDGTVESWEWDAEGNLTAHTDQAGGTTRHTYTHFDLPASRTDADGHQYTFTYDTERHLTQVTNPLGATWDYTYDPAGHLTGESDFNNATLTYTHNAAGQLTSRTNAVDQRIDFTHDPLGRLIRQQASTGEDTTFTYDPADHLITATNPDTQITFERDLAGRVLAESVGGRTTHYGYDPAGRLIQRTTPTGLTSRWTHNPAGQPTRLTTAGHTLAFTHDAAGRETSRHLGDHLTLTQNWDTADRLTSQTLTGADDLLLQHRQYTYRSDGHLTAIRDLTQGLRTYTLTPTGRPTTVSAIGWSETYAYDAAGNTTHAQAPDHPTPGDRQHTGTLIHRAGHTHYTHDAAGRLTRKTRKLLNGQKHTWTYTYNAEDRLVRATNPDGETWHYTYDPLGRRTSKHRATDDGTPTDPTHFTWDHTRLAEQTAPDGTLTTWDYSPGTHRPLAQITRTPLSEDTQDGEPTSRILELAGPTQADYDTAFHAIVTDLVGTPTELVTPTGHLTWQHTTTLWGTPHPTPARDVDCPLRFPGQYHDPETGLHYNHHRYYDPETRAYTAPDPLGLAPGPNPHGYVDNPYAWTDPLGLTPCSSANPDDLLANQGEKIGTQGGARKIQSRDVQSEKELDEYWKIISRDARQVDMPNYPGVVMERADGTRIMRRDVSSDGSPTIDVKPGDGSMQWKIHIKRQ